MCRALLAHVQVLSCISAHFGRVVVGNAFERARRQGTSEPDTQLRAGSSVLTTRLARARSRTAHPAHLTHPRARAQTTMSVSAEKLEQLESTIESLEDNVNKLHTALEKKGVNSRGEKDIFGRVFAMPVRS